MNLSIKMEEALWFVVLMQKYTSLVFGPLKLLNNINYLEKDLKYSPYFYRYCRLIFVLPIINALDFIHEINLIIRRNKFRALFQYILFS